MPVSYTLNPTVEDNADAFVDERVFTITSGDHTGLSFRYNDVQYSWDGTTSTSSFTATNTSTDEAVDLTDTSVLSTLEEILEDFIGTPDLPEPEPEEE